MQRAPESPACRPASVNERRGRHLAEQMLSEAVAPFSALEAPGGALILLRSGGNPELDAGIRFDAVVSVKLENMLRVTCRVCDQC